MPVGRKLLETLLAQASFLSYSPIGCVYWHASAVAIYVAFMWPFMWFHFLLGQMRVVYSDLAKLVYTTRIWPNHYIRHAFGQVKNAACRPKK